MLTSGGVVLLLLGFLGATAAIRSRDGPVVDSEGREYKTARVLEEDSGATSPVTLTCTSSSMIVVVKADLNKDGRLVRPGELFLGEDASKGRCQAARASATELVIEAQLQDCGSTLAISQDLVTYTTTLNFSPAPTRHGISRRARFTLPVSCYYQRTHLVSSSGAGQEQVRPPQSPQTRQTFALKLMSDDWTEESSTRVFRLGDLLHLEASYAGADPKRLFIDSCVASPTPDPTAEPKYHFIDNHGCLADATQPGSRARFWSRVGVESLRLQLDVFLFDQAPQNTIFITCQLKAAPTWQSSQVNKACNFLYTRWQNVDQNNRVCRCCDTLCGRRGPDAVLALSENTGAVTLGPLTVLPSKL